MPSASPPGSPASHLGQNGERSKLRMLLSRILDMLDSEDTILFQIFSDFDPNLTGAIEATDFGALVTSIDPEIGIEKAEDDVDPGILSDDDQCIIDDLSTSIGNEEKICFVEVLGWWEGQKVKADGVANDSKLQAWIKARYASGKVKEYTWGLVAGSAHDIRIQNATDLPRAMKAFQTTLLQLQVWYAAKRARSVEQKEEQMWDQKPQNLNSSTQKTEYLRALFRQYAKEERLDMNGLKKISQLLGYNMPLPIVDMTATMYLKDEYMNEEKFLLWWACREFSPYLEYSGLQTVAYQDSAEARLCGCTPQ
uniref:EF-hand domain-containing protein n=1 Tax=Eutreptiella gymnastica TaxID=73025 RepID=A0A7S1N7N2_9EUGL